MALFLFAWLLIAGTSGTTLSEKAPFFPTADVDILPWSPDRKLTWNDFRGAPRPGGLTGAATHARIRATPRAHPLSGRVRVEVQALFECRKSWVREQAKGNGDLLNHEQRHFDIAEVYARRLRRELVRRRITAANYAEVKREVIDRLFHAYVQCDEAYDRETVHGINRDAQADWDRRIDRQLGSLAGNNR